MEKNQIQKENSETTEISKNLNPSEMPLIKNLIGLTKDQKNSNFQLVYKDKNLKIVKKHTKNNPVILIKAEATLNIKPNLLCELIYNLKWRKKWDKVLSDFKIVDKIDESSDVIFSLYKAPFGISNREFLQKRFIFENIENFDFILAFENAEHENCKVKDGHIRTDSIMGGYLIQKLENDKSYLYIISQTDIKGVIPNWIVNQTASKAPASWIKDLKKGIDLIKMYYRRNNIEY